MPGLRPTIYRPSFKPGGRVEIDFSHPLASKLAFSTLLTDALRPVDLVTGVQASTSPTVMNPTVLGPAVKYNGSSDETNFGDRASWRPGSSDFSVAVFANPTNAAQGGLLSKRNTSSFHQLNFISNTGTSGGFAAGQLGIVFLNDSGVVHIGTTPNTAVDGNFHQFFATAVNSSGVMGLYKDGASLSVTYNTGPSALGSFTGTDPLCIGSGNSSVYLSATVGYAHYWLRALTAAEVEWINAEPFVFVREKPQRFFLVLGSAIASSAGAPALSASATAALGGASTQIGRKSSSLLVTAAAGSTATEVTRKQGLSTASANAGSVSLETGRKASLNAVVSAGGSDAALTGKKASTTTATAVAGLSAVTAQFFAFSAAAVAALGVGVANVAAKASHAVANVLAGGEASDSARKRSLSQVIAGAGLQAQSAVAKASSATVRAVAGAQALATAALVAIPAATLFAVARTRAFIVTARTRILSAIER